MNNTASKFLTGLVVLLLLFGIVMLYSTSYAAYNESKLARQLVWIGLGSVLAFTVRCLDYRKLTRRSWIYLGVSAAALLYLALALYLYRASWFPSGWVTQFPLIRGPVKGSFRWLTFGPASVQPSEFARVALIIFLADYYHRRARYIQQFVRGFFIPMAVSGVVVLLILLGKDLSSTVITGCIVFFMAFIAGVRMRYLVLTGIIGVTLAVLMIVGSPERRSRITAYRDPELHQMNEGYQLWSSQLALGSGAWRGLGFTQSRMKQLYLPEAHTDFIVAIVGEELGFTGILVLIGLYVSTIGAVFCIGMRAEDRAGMLLCSGVALSIGLQAFVNISVVSGFAPTTGVTAPLLSYGGSSMLGTLIGLGFVLSVARISEGCARERELSSSFQVQREPSYRSRIGSQPGG